MTDRPNVDGPSSGPGSLYDPTTGPLVWPECTECGAAYELTRGFRMFAKPGEPSAVWVWRAACKCGKRRRPDPAPARMVNADGPVPS